MSIPQYSDLSLLPPSENEQENSMEQITDFFGAPMTEQMELPMENGKASKKSESPSRSLPVRAISPPEKRIKRAYQELNDSLAKNLLKKIMGKDPWFFERLVVDLLLAMGYGGADPAAGIVTKKTGDGGIDGMIRQDKLGFDQIYIQAKRYKPDSSVHKPEIHKFCGALQEVKASKGLFITTAKFSDGAKTSAESQRVVLVDGERLTKLMIEYNVGVSTVAKYEIKAVDSDFFNDDNG